jgi:hypothetical protein
MSELTTAEDVQRAIESPPEGVETFYSVHRGLQLLRQKTVATESAVTGHKIVHVEPVTYRFAPLGVLHVKHGQDMLPDGPGGEMQDAVAWLTSHPRLNRRFQWQGHEAGRPLPLEGDFLAAVTQATAHGDVTTLMRLRREEEETHARALLLSAVNNALEALRSAPQATPEEDEEPMPPDWDRKVALEYLADRDVTIADDATDAQILAIVRQTAADEEDTAA